jgi:hypothetical protein
MFMCVAWRKHRQQEWVTNCANLHLAAIYEKSVCVDFPEGRKQVPVLVTTWSHSGFWFAMGFPTERLLMQLPIDYDIQLNLLTSELSVYQDNCEKLKVKV